MSRNPRPQAARALRSCVLRACALLVLAACAGTETDNPVTDNGSKPGEPFESPTHFDPSSGAPPGCVPPEDDGMPRRLARWGRDGTWVIGADRYGGLRVLDASDAAQPRIASQIPLAGEPRTLLVEPGLSVTLAIDELPELQQASVPEPRELEPVTRLVRYVATDPGDPSALTRLSDVAIEGELWRVVQHAGVTWVMSAKLAAPEPLCDRDPYGCGYSDRVGLILTGYRFGDGSWSVVQRVELPMFGGAWSTPEGFASYEAQSDADANFTGGELHVVRFQDDGQLGSEVTLQTSLSAVPAAPISLANGRARVFLRDPNDGAVQLALFDLATRDELGALRGIAHAARSTEFTADAVYVGDEGSQQGALLVDTSDPRAPRAVSLPAPVSQVLPLDSSGTRLLGFGQDPNGGGVRAVLLSVANGTPAVLDEAVVPDAVADVEHERLWLTGTAERALFVYRTQSGALLGGFAIGTDSLDWLEPDVQSYADELVDLGDAVYAPDSSGLAVVSLAPSGPAGTRLDWNAEVSAYVVAGDYEAALVRSLSGPLTLELSRGADLHTFTVSPGARRLVAGDDHVIVLSFEPREQCAQTGLDCSDYEPNVQVFALGDAPALVAELPLPDADLALNEPDAQVRLEWESEAAPLALGGGRYLFVAQLEASCTQPGACDELGIDAVPIADANVNVTSPGGTPDCPPNVDDCEPAPAPAAPTVYGSKRTQRLTVLDVGHGEPRFGETVESVLELDDSRFAAPRFDRGVVLATRLERKAQRPTPGVPSKQTTTARFMLDRFELDDETGLRALPAVNVPGYPLALRGDGSLLIAIEPDAENAGAAILHRLALRDAGARVLQRVPLPARFGGFALAGDRVIYLSRDGDGCDGTTALTAIALSDDEDEDLRVQPELVLPGVGWTIADHEPGRVLLATTATPAFTLIDLGEREPGVEVFVSTARYAEQPRLEGSAIVAAGHLWGKQRIEL